MFSTKKNIEQSIEAVKNEVNEFVTNGGKIKNNKMIAVIYVVQVSPRKCVVSWNFARENVKIGDDHSYDTGCGYITGKVVHIFK